MEKFPDGLKPKTLKKIQELGVKADDIEEKFIRGSGKGGQKINKTSNAVWLKHIPTGIEVKCQRYRERETNRKTAYRMLVDKIEFKIKGEKSEKAKKIYKIRKQKLRRSKRTKEKMLEEKKQRSKIKKTRKQVEIVED